MKYETYELWWENNLGKSYTHEGAQHAAPDEDGFLTWMGDPFAVDRHQVRSLLDRKVKTFLDVGCGAAPEYIGLQHARPDIEYMGVDITPRLVSYCTKKGIDVVLGSARALPFEDSTVDVVHTRHVLEHMAYFKEPMDEFIRVARHHVYVSFFLAPVARDESIITNISDMDIPCYNNVYSLREIEGFLNAQKKVDSHRWYSLSGHSKCLLHIQLISPPEVDIK